MNTRHGHATAAPIAVDELTGLTNRAAGLDRLRELWAQAVRYGEPISCLLISFDHVRAINDAHGMSAGDHVLREMARLLRAFARTEEHLCRLSGNEFLVMCPKSSARSAAIGAERHRWAVQSSVIAWGMETLHLTASIGVAERTDDMTRIDHLIAAAGDAAMAAQQRGGNRVRIASGPADATAVRRRVTEAWETSDTAPDRSAEQATMRVVIVHDEACDDVPTFCDMCAGWGFACKAVPLDAFSPSAQAIGAVVVVAIGRDVSVWPPVIRSIRSRDAARRTPVVILGAPENESCATALLNEGARAFVASTDPPRSTQQLMQTLVREHKLERELDENQAMRAEQARMLTALFDLTRSFAAADSLERCLDRLMNIAREMLHVGRVVILVSKRDRKGMSIARATDGDVAIEELDDDSYRGGLIEQACTQRETMLITDLAPYRNRLTDVERGIIERAPAAITPMVTAQRVVGVLIASEKPGTSGFKPWEIAMLDLLSNIAAASIDDHHARTARDEAREAIVVALAKLTQHRDGPTAEHVDRVSRICVTLARNLAHTTAEQFPEIDDSFITNLEWAVPLHDIGKVGLPDSILLKPGRLTDDEMEIMRTHVEIGQSALHSISMRVPEAEYLRMAEQIAHYHHEWFDGTGYPSALSGEDIPLAARIASVADAYDAITSSRSYKKAVAHDAACAEITRRAGTQFDPRIVAAFERCMHLFAAAGTDEEAAIIDRTDAA